MKKISVILAIMALFTTTSALAIPEDQVAVNVKTAFNANFSKATQVKWDKVEEFYFATFILNEKEVNVAYNESGELVGSSEILTLDRMPLLTQIALRERYSNYNHSPQAYRITCNGETFYYVTAVNDKRILKLKCTNEGYISVVEKTKLTKS